MALMDDALRIQFPLESGIPGSSGQWLPTAVSNSFTKKSSASFKGILLPMAILLLNLLTACGVAELGASRYRPVYAAASKGLAARFAALDEYAVPFSLLKDLADQAIRQDPAFLGKVRFSAHPEDRTFSINLAAVPSDLLLSKSDTNAPVLDALIRVAALRRDLQAAFPGEDSWRAEADGVEQAAKRCMQASGSGGSAGADPETCLDQIDGSFSIFRKAVIAFATAKGLKERNEDTRGIPGYPVHVAIMPPRAKLKVMTLLEYKKCQYLQKPKEQYEWTDLVGSTFQMIGKYRYRVEWPADLNGPEEGDIEITGPQTLTFTPSR